MTSTEVGKYFLSSSVSSGQPSVPIGQRPEENQVSSTSGSRHIGISKRHFLVGPVSTVRVISQVTRVASIKESFGGCSLPAALQPYFTKFFP